MNVLIKISEKNLRIHVWLSPNLLMLNISEVQADVFFLICCFNLPSVKVMYNTYRYHWSNWGDYWKFLTTALFINFHHKELYWREYVSQDFIVISYNIEDSFFIGPYCFCLWVGGFSMFQILRARFEALSVEPLSWNLVCLLFVHENAFQYIFLSPINTQAPIQSKGPIFGKHRFPAVGSTNSLILFTAFSID